MNGFGCTVDLRIVDALLRAGRRVNVATWCGMRWRLLDGGRARARKAA